MLTFQLATHTHTNIFMNYNYVQNIVGKVYPSYKHQTEKYIGVYCQKKVPFESGSDSFSLMMEVPWCLCLYLGVRSRKNKARLFLCIDVLNLHHFIFLSNCFSYVFIFFIHTQSLILVYTSRSKVVDFREVSYCLHVT